MKIFYLLALALFHCFAYTQEIVWFTDDQADLHDLLRDNPVSISTDTNNLVLKVLPQYQINFQYAPIPRITNQLINLENACVGNRIKTEERVKDNLFSLPLNFYPSYRLYYLKNNISLPPELFNDKNQLISLAHLFEILPNTVLAVEKGRSFGPTLDEIIPNLPENNVFVRPGNDGYSAISKLLFIGRVDFIIGFPTEMKERIKKATIEQEIQSVEIANIDNYIVGHIACSKSPIGEKFIHDVDNILKRAYQSDEYINAHLRYLDKVDHQAFRDYFDVFKKQLFLTR
ncbi:hypothetical protein [Thalassotalea fusca]